MTSRSVSLTGASGFVGGHIAEAFLRDGWQVRAVVRPGRDRLLPRGVEPVFATLKRELLVEAFRGAAVVVHCAGVVRARNLEAFTKINVEGTRTVVEAANVTGSRLIHISSQAAGGTGTVARPRRENDREWPVNDYGRSKLASEVPVRELAAVPWTIIRPCAVYGPRDRGFLPLFRAARRGLFLSPARPDAAFTLIDVRDLAEAVRLAAVSDQAVSQTFFVGHAVPRTTTDILVTMAAVFGKTAQPVTIPLPVVRAAAIVGELAWRLNQRFVIDGSRYAELSSEGFVCSVDAIRERLGFVAATDLYEGFRSTKEWYEQAGWLMHRRS